MTLNTGRIIHRIIPGISGPAGSKTYRICPGLCMAHFFTKSSSLRHVELVFEKKNLGPSNVHALLQYVVFSFLPQQSWRSLCPTFSSSAVYPSGWPNLAPTTSTFEQWRRHFLYSVFLVPGSTSCSLQGIQD